MSSTTEFNTQHPVLVTGATGYIGGRLVPRLLALGHRVRVLTRSENKLRSRPWADDPNIEIVTGDVFDVDSVATALTGCRAAYYLIHSMNPSQDNFETADSRAAQIFVSEAEKAGVGQLVYLSGLGEDDKDLSKHLRSRHEVETILGSTAVPLTTFRAAMIIGSGSASFEILRYLVNHLPIMITPKWVQTPTQPIGIANVLTYLVECLDHPDTLARTFDIGSTDVVTYRELMTIYAEEAGMRPPIIIPVPVFSPKLSSYWIHIVTPVHASLAQPLALGLRNPTVCKDTEIRDIIPQDLMTVREAVAKALTIMNRGEMETHWTDAGTLPPAEYVYPGDPEWSGGRIYSDKRVMTVESSAQEMWKPIVEIGGQNGWYYGNWLWWIRATMDVFLGGTGFRSGRRHPSQLYAGDALDFWRVVDVQEGKHLKLKAEMKVPGEAYLEFHLADVPNETNQSQCEIKQLAYFVPRGIFGIAYWVLVTPLHEFVFTGMLKGIAKAAEKSIISSPKKIKA